MSISKKIYFASDFHLGIPDHANSLQRERRIIAWLDSIKESCAELFLVGDLFDFWFEYKLVVPKGFVRLQAKIAEFTDAGIPVHLFHGNHDLWQFGYFEKELGVIVHQSPIERTFFGKQFYIGHGDGLGPGQLKFKFILWIYRNYFFQKLFGFFHPSIGMSLANWFSHRSKQNTGEKDLVFYEEKEYLIQYCKTILAEKSINYFVFGHRHLPMVFELNQQSSYINLGDWIKDFTYLELDQDSVQLKKFEQ